MLGGPRLELGNLFDRSNADRGECQLNRARGEAAGAVNGEMVNHGRVKRHVDVESARQGPSLSLGRLVSIRTKDISDTARSRRYSEHGRLEARRLRAHPTSAQIVAATGRPTPFAQQGFC